MRRDGLPAASPPLPARLTLLFSPLPGPGRVPVKAQPRRRLRDLSRVDRRHQALQLRRQRKEAVRKPGRFVRGEREGERSEALAGRFGMGPGPGLRVGAVTELGWGLAGPVRFGKRSMSARLCSGGGVGDSALDPGRERSRWRLGIHAVPRCPQVLAEKRSLGSRDGAPHLVVLVLLHSRAAAQDTLRLLQSQDSAVVRADEGSAGGFALLCPRLKQRWRFVPAPAGEEVPSLVGFLVLVALTASLMEVF